MKTRTKVVLGVLVCVALVWVCAALFGVWFYMGRKYTAVAYLRVAIVEEPVLRSIEPYEMDPSRFEIYKSTQEQLLLSRFVLMAALRKPVVYRIPAIQEEQRNGDPVDWLMRRVSVSFPGKAEVMAVSVIRDDPAEAQTLVNAIVDAYLTEVVNVERDRKRQRVTELETVCAAKEQDLRRMMQELHNLAPPASGDGGKAVSAITSSVDLEMLQLESKIAEQWLIELRMKLKRLKAELRAPPRITLVERAELPLTKD